MVVDILLVYLVDYTLLVVELLLVYSGGGRHSIGLLSRLYSSGG